MANPFVYGRLLRPEELIDREEELALLTERLVDGARHFLIGPRRFGKSSLLRVAADRAGAAGTPCVTLNLEEHTSLDAAAGSLAAGVAELFAPTLRERMLRVSEWFAALKPVTEYDPMTDAVKVSVAPRDRAPAAQSLADALAAADAVAKSRGTVVGVVLDEFQVVNDFGGLAAERQLRAVIQRHEHLSYVFAGSQASMLLAMISDHARPFYRLGDAQFLGPVPRADFSPFITDAFARRRQTIAPEALTELFATCEDVPYNVQRLCAGLWSRHRERAGAVLAKADVDEALATILDRGHAQHLALFLTFTQQQRKVLAGMAAGDALDEQTTRVARRLGIAVSTYRTARTSFLRQDILYERFGPGQTTRRYAFVDPFFKRWLRRFVRG